MAQWMLTLVLAIAVVAAVGQRASAGAAAGACDRSPGSCDNTPALAEEGEEGEEEEGEEQALFQTPGQMTEQQQRQQRKAADMSAARRPEVSVRSAPEDSDSQDGGEEQALLQLARPAVSLHAAGGSLRQGRRATVAAGHAPPSTASDPSPVAAAEALQLRGAARGGFASDEVLESDSDEDTAEGWEGVVLFSALSLCGMAAVFRAHGQREHEQGELIKPKAFKDAHEEGEPIKPNASKDVNVEPPRVQIYPAAVPEPAPEAMRAAAPRLSHVGASYAVPWSHIAHAGERSLSVEVPVAPAVWPLRASFLRAAGESSWARIELSVDVIDAAGLPPLLYCMRCGGGGSAGDTGATWGGASRAEQLAEGEGRSAWVEVCGGSGALAAVIVKEADGQLSVQRPGHAPWEVLAPLASEDMWVAVRKRGQDLALATRSLEEKPSEAVQSILDGVTPELRAKLKERLSRIHGEKDEEACVAEGGQRQERVQVDTLPETSSPESVLLLMCMLAALLFPR